MRFEDHFSGHADAYALWYRMIAGGSAPRYVRLRPRASLSAILGERSALPDVAKITIEILSLRPAMSYSLPTAADRSK